MDAEGTVLDQFGIHLATCKHGGGRIFSRHESLGYELQQLCGHAAVRCEKVREGVGDILGNGLRLDYLAFPSGVGHGVDVTISNPLSGGDHSPSNAKAFTSAREHQKIEKYAGECDKNNLRFAPFVLDSFGSAGPRTRTLMKSLFERIPLDTFEIPNWAAPTPSAYWNQRMAVQVVKSTADCIIRLLSYIRYPGPFVLQWLLSAPERIVNLALYSGFRYS